MKEATGELSTTVIAIVAIAAILAVFTVFLLPTLRSQIALTQACNNGPSYNTSTGSYKISCGKATTSNNTTTWTCTYINSKGSEAGSKTCTQN